MTEGINVLRAPGTVFRPHFASDRAGCRKNGGSSGQWWKWWEHGPWMVVLDALCRHAAAIYPHSKGGGGRVLGQTAGWHSPLAGGRTGVVVWAQGPIPHTHSAHSSRSPQGQRSNNRSLPAVSHSKWNLIVTGKCFIMNGIHVDSTGGRVPC